MKPELDSRVKPIILILTALFLAGCATHYIPSECPVTGPPPVAAKVEWVKICIEDTKTHNVTCWYAIKDASNINKARTNEKMKDLYSQDCYEKIGSEQK